MPLLLGPMPLLLGPMTLLLDPMPLLYRLAPEIRRHIIGRYSRLRPHPPSRNTRSCSLRATCPATPSSFCIAFLLYSTLRHNSLAI